MSATVEDLAAALGVETEAIDRAVESGDVDPLTDTARQKRQEREDRATAPELRSLAFTREAFEQLVDVNEGAHPQEAERLPRAEGRKRDPLLNPSGAVDGRCIDGPASVLLL